MARNYHKKLCRNKALARALIGTARGIITALPLAGVATLAPAALAIQPVDRPALSSAMEDCESAAMDRVATGRALGACDLLVRSPELDDAMRARVFVNRGVIALARGSGADARSDLEQAVMLAPDLSEAWLNLAAARIATGSPLEGADAARRAEELGADPALSRFNEAIALETAGQYDAAYAAYVSAAELAPDNITLQAQPRRFLRHQPQ